MTLESIQCQNVFWFSQFYAINEPPHWHIERLRELRAQVWLSWYVCVCVCVCPECRAHKLACDAFPHNLILRFQVVTAVWLKIQIFWDMTPCFGKQLPGFWRSPLPIYSASIQTKQKQEETYHGIMHGGSSLWSLYSKNSSNTVKMNCIGKWLQYIQPFYTLFHTRW